MQSTADKCLQNLLHIAAGLRHHSNAGHRQGLFHSPGNRAADQQIRPAFGQASRSEPGVLDVEDHVLSCLLDPSLDFDDKHSASHIEDGTDPTVPVRYSDFHRMEEVYKFRAMREGTSANFT